MVLIKLIESGVKVRGRRRISWQYSCTKSLITNPRAEEFLDVPRLEATSQSDQSQIERQPHRKHNLHTFLMNGKQTKYL